MEIFGICISAVCAAVLVTLISRSSKEYAVLAGCGACIAILLGISGELTDLVNQLRGYIDSQDLAADCLETVLKAVGIGLVAHLAASVCRDAGEGALGFTVELAGKAAILAVSLGLITQTFTLLDKITQGIG